MPIPPWISFDPDEEALRRDFEEAYVTADIGNLPEGGSDPARQVSLILQRKRPISLILQRASGPSWIVGDPGRDADS